ncbi:MAG: amidoligase family protein [Desulfobacterales bacterium]
MMIPVKNFILPPLIQNSEGNIRKVGFELEFSGIKLNTAAQIVADLFDGKIVAESRFLFKVIETVYGDFSVELDAAVLKDQRYKEYLLKIGFDIDRHNFGDDLENVLSKMAETLVPHEIVLPPIPVTELDIVETLKEKLRSLEAKGTKASILYAFSLQINPEVPSLEPDTILDYLKAFVLLYNWIFKISGIDLSRRIAPFIKEFPANYIHQILKSSYRPTMNSLIDDYLIHNATRNRPLDMLPLFCFIDSDRVFQHPVEKELIKARPAFHYRLPNSLIDDPAWTVAHEWNLWVEVERLANDSEKIKKMADDFMNTVDFPLGIKMFKWIEKVPYWLGIKSQ